MACFFELGVECGQTPDAWKDMVSHFEGISLHLSSGTRVACNIGYRIPWVIVNPRGLATYGNDRELLSKRSQSELGHSLYEQLRHAPPFRFALVGWEASNWLEYEELEADDLGVSGDGLVISTDIWERFGEPNGFFEFRPGYVWRPYCGETTDS